MLNCDPGEIIVEHDKAAQIWAISRSTDETELAEYLMPETNFQSIDVDTLKKIESNIIVKCQQLIPGSAQRQFQDTRLSNIKQKIHEAMEHEQERSRREAALQEKLNEVIESQLSFTSYQASEAMDLKGQLPDKAIREGALKKALHERGMELLTGASKLSSADRISGVVESKDEHLQAAATAVETRGKVAGSSSPLEDVVNILQEVEAALPDEMEEYFLSKATFLEGREQWQSQVTGATQAKDLIVPLLALQATVSEAVMKNWWKNDVELWRATVEGSKTSAQMRLLVAWLFRALKRIPGTEIVEEIYEAPEPVKPKKEPEVDRRTKRLQERESRDLQLRVEEAQKKSKSSKKQKAAKEEHVEEDEEPWEYGELLPEWAKEGCLVWAKVGGFPWWPALLNAPEDSPGVKRRPSKPDNVWVFNLGAGNFSEVKTHAKGIVPYERATIGKYDTQDKMKGKTLKQFKAAKKLADSILAENEVAGNDGSEGGEDRGTKRRTSDTPEHENGEAEPDAKRLKGEG